MGVEPQKKYDEAIEHYNRAIQLEPTFARAYYNKGMALSGQNRLSEAIEEFRTSLRYDPDFPRARRQLEAALTENK